VTRVSPLLMVFAAATLAIAAPRARADTTDEEIERLRQTTINVIQLLVQSGILTQEKADALLREARKQAADAIAEKQKAESRVVRVPYVPETVRSEIKQELHQEVVAQAKEEGWAQPNAIPDWAKRINIRGDLRLRHQAAYQSPDNAAYISVQDTNAGNGLQLLNTTQDMVADKLRARLALDLKIADEVTGGLQITTGTTTNPVSTNQTLGNTFNKYSIVLDQAWVQYKPSSWLGFTGGRMPNPWLSTDLIWAADLSFEGLIATLRAPLDTETQAFLVLGGFPLERLDCSLATQVNTCSRNKTLWAGQAGIDYGLAGGAQLRLGFAYYNFQNIAGELITDPAATTSDFRTRIPKFAQKGNTLFNVAPAGSNPLLGLASDFRVAAATVRLDIPDFSGVYLSLQGEYVRNLGYDADQIQSRTQGGALGPGFNTDIRPRTKGYNLGLTFGTKEIEKAYDWQVTGNYKVVERDAVVDGFNDPDFHLGGTDAKGWILGASLGIARNTWLRLRWLTSDAIDGPPLAIDVLQFDFNVRF